MVKHTSILSERFAGAQFALYAFISVLMRGTAGAVSLPIRVDTSPNHNRHWTTAFTNEIPLRWEWNAAASSAELKAVGMNGSFATNFTAVTSNYLWRAFTSGVDTKRLTRGGRWSEAAQYCRAVYRTNNTYPNTRSKNIGFRLVRTLQ